LSFFLRMKKGVNAQAQCSQLAVSLRSQRARR
jgi:hypothetical protein